VCSANFAGAIALICWLSSRGWWHGCAQETQLQFWLEQQTFVNMTDFAPVLDDAFESAMIPVRPGFKRSEKVVKPVVVDTFASGARTLAPSVMMHRGSPLWLSAWLGRPLSTAGLADSHVAW
jgi:hypothetical protein